MAVWERLRLLFGPPPAPRLGALGGFLDTLLQTFENCREGLSDAQALAGAGEAERFFTQLYEREKPRLQEALALHGGHLSPAARAELMAAVDARVRGVLVPAYARLSAPFTVRERNDFYLTPPAFHLLERLGLAVAGMLVGAFVVWAPFIPIWSKELVLVFGLGGLVLPELRRVAALRRYQGALNRLVSHGEADVGRVEMALMTGEVMEGARAEEGAAAGEPAAALDERLAELPPAPLAAPRPKARQHE